MSKWGHISPHAGPRRRARRPPDQLAFPTLEPFARRLESLRLERGLTQRALAARAHISTNHYREIAHAQANPTIIVLISLVEALEVPLAALFESPPRPPDGHRNVRLTDLNDLVTTHRQLAGIVERLTKDDLRPRVPKRP